MPFLSSRSVDDTVTSPTTDRAAVAKKRFTLQGFSNLKSQKGITGFPVLPNNQQGKPWPVSLCTDRRNIE